MNGHGPCLAERKGAVTEATAARATKPVHKLVAAAREEDDESEEEEKAERPAVRTKVGIVEPSRSGDTYVHLFINTHPVIIPCIHLSPLSFAGLWGCSLGFDLPRPRESRYRHPQSLHLRRSSHPSSSVRPGGDSIGTLSYCTYRPALEHIRPVLTSRFG